MKYINRFYIIFTFFTISFASSQTHLEPVDGIFCMYDFKFEYYPKVREILLKDLYDSPEARYLILPSFSGETVVDVMNIMEKYSLEYRKAETSIWYAHTRKNIEVNVKKITKNISKDDATLIINVFKKAILQVKYPEKKIIGYDGENYYFSAENKSGTIWSPQSNSKMSKLVEIGNDLIEFVLNDKPNFDEDFIKRIQELDKEL